MIATMRDFFDPITPAHVDWSGQVPTSAVFDDGYFGHDNAPSEAQAVFIEGNRLAQRFDTLQTDEVFVIGETGFGTGLNVLLAASLFEQRAHPGARLEIVSVDLHPLQAQDLARAVALWPSLGVWSQRLLMQYPAAAPGHHRVGLSDNIGLTLIWGDATTAFEATTARVDAWFLDGFAPARNPTMWTPALFRALYARSAPGATLASFTAAGDVRRGLAEAGFAIERQPGFAGKRHRIVGTKPGTAVPRHQRRGHAVIAGAGLAGATTARALAKRGWTVRVCDPNPPASGASGNWAGVVYATPSPHLQSQNRFYLNALIRALVWFRLLDFPHHSDQGRLNDVLLHLKQPRRKKNAHLAHSTGAWPDALLDLVDDDTARLKGAGYIQPKAWVEHLLNHPNITHHHSKVISPQTCDGDVVVLANAHSATEFQGLHTLPIKSIRGQVTELQATPDSQALHQAHCHMGYFTPALMGRHCVGATYDLHAEHTGSVESDDRDNVDQFKTHLPAHWQALGGDALEIVGHRSAFRCTTPDRLPIVGHVPAVGEGVYINIGHGSRGITHTPLCADLLADQISQSMDLGGPAMDPQMIRALSPTRYLTEVL